MYAMNDERRQKNESGKNEEKNIKCGKYCKSGNFFICFTRARHYGYAIGHTNSGRSHVEECVPDREQVAAGACCHYYYYYFDGRNLRNRHLYVCDGYGWLWKHRPLCGQVEHVCCGKQLFMNLSCPHLNDIDDDDDEKSRWFFIFFQNINAEIECSASVRSSFAFLP